MRHFRLFLLVWLAAMMAANGAGDWKVDERGVLMAIAKAPAKARAWTNPYAGDPQAIRAGRKLFLQHCAECHGKNGRGISRAANLHLADVQRATPGELAWFLRNGNLADGMPSWSGLPAQRRWQIVTYLKTLR